MICGPATGSCGWGLCRQSHRKPLTCGGSVLRNKPVDEAFGSTVGAFDNFHMRKTTQ